MSGWPLLPCPHFLCRSSALPSFIAVPASCWFLCLGNFHLSFRPHVPTGEAILGLLDQDGGPAFITERPLGALCVPLEHFRGDSLALICVCVSVSKECWLAAVTNRSQASSN